MAIILSPLCAPPVTFLSLASDSRKNRVSVRSASPVCHRKVACAKSAGECGMQLSSWTSVRRERWEGDLAVEGHIPVWLNGTYLRNGPGVWEVGDHACHHIFDGYATLVRVSFRQGRATGAHRQIESEAYKNAKEHGRPLMREFSQLCPPHPVSLLDRVHNLIGLGSGALLSDNANISVHQLGDGRVMCLTETTKSTILIDPETLDTIGKFHYEDMIWGLLQSTHPIVTKTELLTLLPDFPRRGHLIVRMAAGSNERKVLGRVHCRGGLAPGWVHSFAVTDNFIVVPEMPLRYSIGGVLKSQLTPLYIFDWLPDTGSYMHIICRSTGKTVASVEVPTFMALHFINAYEEKHKDSTKTEAIIADCCEYYGDPAIIESLALHRLRSVRADKEPFPDARVARFRIPLDGAAFGKLETVLDPKEHGCGVEMSTVNPAYHGKAYRYVYACGACRPCNFYNSLTKIDLVEKKAKNWHEVGAVPSEPFFVARPGATDEDDGIVISVVSTVNGGSYTVLLDAKTFTEIARLRFPYGLPYGFHGCWIPGKIY